MNRLWIAGIVLTVALGAPACSDKDEDPSDTVNNTPRFQAALLQSNEFPVIDNADRTGSGIANITLHLTRDGSNNITAATIDFVVTLQNFPANTTLTGAHIHPGRAGTSGSVLVNANVASGEIVLSATGSGSINKLAQPITAEQAQNIINDPAAFYFNVHTTLSTGGAVRGQLVAQ
jgi:hypothetical protein